MEGFRIEDGFLALSQWPLEALGQRIEDDEALGVDPGVLEVTLSDLGGNLSEQLVPALLDGSPERVRLEGEALKIEEFRAETERIKVETEAARKDAETQAHEATTSKISEDQLFYCRQRGLSAEDAVSLIVNGFCKEVLQELPMEFAVEAQKLVSISLEGSVG